jgi:RNA polymerase sigma factor (sigma-70 family)
MQPTDDRALLRQYAENHSDEAFATLVTRHVNLVYSVALRQVGNAHQAEEITQAVFIILAKKALQLRHDKALSSWLFQATRLTANNFVRSEARRQRREQEAYMQTVLEESGAETWPRIAPLLDAAVAALSEKDRRAIVLRFYEGRNLSEVGAALGAGEAAAKKRVTRALEKLQRYFSRRGVHSTAATIAETISANSVQAAPVALAKSVTIVAMAKGSIATASMMTLVKGTIKVMTYANLKLALGITTAVLLAGGVVTVALKSAENKATPIAGNGQNSASKNLLITSEFVEVPGNLLGDLPAAATAVLTKSQHTNILGTLKQNKKVTVFSQPSIVFPLSPGESQKGSMSMTKPANIAGTNAETGIIWDVNATLSSDSKSVALNLNFEWRELADASPLHDGSQVEIRTTKTTAMATLIPGQTILVRQPAVGDAPDLGGNTAGSTNLLVFVTPQIAHLQQRLQQIIRKSAP